MGADWKQLRLIVLVAVSYYAAAKVGLALAFINPSATAIWPPSGIGMAAVLLAGRTVWPGIFLGALAANYPVSGPVSALTIGIGNTLEALVGAMLLRRWGGNTSLARTSDVFRFAALAGAVAPLVAATVGAIGLLFSERVASSDFARVWLTWWLGDGLGVLIFGSLILTWAGGRSWEWTRSRAVEVTFLVLAVSAGGFIVFDEWLLNQDANYPLAFTSVPVVLWAAVRFGQREAAISTVAFSAIAIWATLHGNGQFAESAPHASLVLLQSFMGVLALTGLLVGALVHQHERLLARLEQRVLERTAQFEQANESLVRQVRQREAAERALRLSEMRLLEAQAFAHVGSWERDSTDGRLWWSDELCRLFDVGAGSALDVDAVVEHVHLDDRAAVRDVFSRSLDGGHSFELTFRVIRPDGSLRWLAWRGHAAHDDAGRLIRVLGTVQDVSEARRAEADHAALQHEQLARQQAEEANRLKDRFLATVSHELRTPINAVAGWAHMLAAGLVTPDRMPKVLEVIERNAQTQVKLIDDLLDVSDLTSGRFRLEPRRVELGSIVSTAVETVRLAAGAKKITIDVRLEDSIVIRGDAHRLQQIVWNLLANAVKFTPDGGRVEVTMGRNSGFATIVVTDSGSGIDAPNISHVFDPFWQGHSDDRGLGLGLAIVRALTEAHGGTVNVTSGLTGRGSTFTVRLPLRG